MTNEFNEMEKRFGANYQAPSFIESNTWALSFTLSAVVMALMFLIF